MSPDGIGWIIVDSLDTLMIMNLTSRLSDAREWLHETLNYDQDQDVNTFETTIRLLGGLLSAHYLAAQLSDASSQRDHVYLSKAVDLADRLLGAYESRSGIPYASVNLRTTSGISSHTDGGASSTAEPGTVQLEMNYLAYVTGKEIYWRKAEKVMKALDDNNVEGGLLPIYVHPESGRFMSREIRLGCRGDSYYGLLGSKFVICLFITIADIWQSTLSSSICRLPDRNQSILKCGHKRSLVSKSIWLPQRSSRTSILSLSYRTASAVHCLRKWTISSASCQVLWL